MKAARVFQVVEALQHHVPRLLPNGSGDAQTQNNIHGMHRAKMSQL